MPPPAKRSVVRCDAKHLDIRVNTNPSRYRFELVRPLAGVHKVSLVQSKVPMSPLFTVVRISDFEAAGTLLAATDTFHQLAVRMATAIGSDPATSSYAATIRNPAGTVYLQVFDVVTATETRTGDDFRTYDLMLCTGYVNTTASTDWTITAEGETANVQLTPAGDNASLTVVREVVPAILRLRLNGNVIGRIIDPVENEEQWRSYNLYYPGQIVQYTTTSGSARYICNTKHLSTVFANNLASNYWSAMSASLTRTQPPDHDAFAVFEDASEAQHIQVTQFSTDSVEQDVNVGSLRFIDIEWVTQNGRPYIFPYDTALRITDVETTDTYTNERVYQYPSFELQLHHQEYGM